MTYMAHHGNFDKYQLRTQQHTYSQTCNVPEFPCNLSHMNHTECIERAIIPCDFQAGPAGDAGVIGGGDEPSVDCGRTLSPVLFTRAAYRALRRNLLTKLLEN